MAISHLIRAYQVNGHTAAKLDPLGLHNRETFPYRPAPLASGFPEELDLEYFGFTEADLDRKLHFKGRSAGGNKGYLEELANAPGKVTLRGILEELRRTYCGTLAVEYMHVSRLIMAGMMYVWFISISIINPDNFFSILSHLILDWR